MLVSVNLTNPGAPGAAPVALALRLKLLKSGASRPAARHGGPAAGGNEDGSAAAAVPDDARLERTSSTGWLFSTDDE